MRDFLTAFALLLVFEGVLPFLSPERSKRMAEWYIRMPEAILRRGGLVAMLAGLLLLYFVH